MLVDLKKMTAALAPTATTMLTFASGRVPEQQAPRPSSHSVISMNRVVAAALQAEKVPAFPTPARCSTIGSTVNIGSNHVVVASPTSGTAHLPATSSTDAQNSILQGVVSSGANTPAGCSTQILTCGRTDHGARACDVKADMPFAPPLPSGGASSSSASTTVADGSRSSDLHCNGQNAFSFCIACLIENAIALLLRRLIPMT